MLEALGEASPFRGDVVRVSFCIAAMGSIWFPNAGCSSFNSAQPSRLSVKSLNWSVCAFTPRRTVL